MLFPIKCTATLKTMLATNYHISIEMLPKSLNPETFMSH